MLLAGEVVDARLTCRATVTVGVVLLEVTKVLVLKVNGDPVIWSGHVRIDTELA